MSRIAWGSFAVGVIATMLVLWFMKGRKKVGA
jgi:hypothetical protein